jgi:mannan endo-1,4-beta-mannosidase
MSLNPLTVSLHFPSSNSMDTVRRTASTHGVNRGRRAIFACLLALALACAMLPAAASAHQGMHHGKGKKGKGHKHKAKGHKRTAISPRPTYWGAWIDDRFTGEKPPWDMTPVSQLAQMVGKGLSLVEFAAPFYDCGSSPCKPLRFPTSEMEAIRGYGAIPVFGWGSNSIPVPEVPLQPDFELSDVAAGSYDDYIREFAEDARDWGHPFFLRFNWEMNGNWFPWGSTVNGAQPGDYVAAWRRVHDIFTAVGATNATWVWCPYADTDRKLEPLGPLYPGDTYVDWTCLSGFNWAKNATNPHPWRTFDEIFKPSYLEIVRHIAPSKPMMLAEIASTGSHKKKAAWISDMFTQLATKYRRIRALVWFDQVDRGIDWPLETSPAAMKAFGKGVRHWAFKGNGYASSSASPVPPPR